MASVTRVLLPRAGTRSTLAAVDELREAIARASGWWQAVPLLSPLNEAQCREIAPALERWPDASREAPMSWMRPALAGEAPPPALSLCRCVSLVEARVDEEEGLARLLARVPEIARLELGMCARGLRAATLANLGALRELRIVTVDPFTTAVTDEEVAELAAAPLARLEKLSLDMVRLRGPGVAALARSTTITALRELELYAPAPAAVCKALDGPALRGIQRLALCADGFTEAAASALARAELAQSVRALALRVTESSGFDWAEPFSGVAPEGARNARRLASALARLIPELRQCEYMSVEYCPDRHVSTIGREAFAALAADPRRLREAFPAAMRRA